MNNEKVLEIVKEEVGKVLELLNIENDVTYGIRESEDVLIVDVSIEGDDLGYMIGNKGLHMQSLQFILSQIVRNRVKKEDEEKKVGIYLDISGYRTQRVSKIESIALQKADDARILGEPVELQPMNAGDRRIVHTTLSKFDDIKTESQGEGRDRYVVITPLTEDEIGVSSSDDEESEETQE